MGDTKVLETLRPEDKQLFAFARHLLRDRGRQGKHSVAAAVRTETGIFGGLDLISRKSSICGEPAAISAAHSSGSYRLEAIVAVCFRPITSEYAMISPCGACRELVNFHEPECRVLFEYDGKPVEVIAKDLFSYPVIFG